MNKTKIEWCDYTWNPIKGLCPVGCWYCFARKIYKRFKLDPEPWLDIAELNTALFTKRAGKRVFVCSTFELFHPAADTIHERGWSWRDYVFDVIRRRPDLTFIILTKMPERIDRPMPDNVWLGVSATNQYEAEERIIALRKGERRARVLFASLEPLLAPIDVEGLCGLLDWMIIGRLTGHGRISDPATYRLRLLVDECKAAGVPLFMKDNLSGIWPGKLIQEWPKER